NDVPGGDDWRGCFSRRLEYAVAQYRCSKAGRLDNRIGVGYLLDTFQDPAHRGYTNVDTVDIAPAAGRSVDVTLLESAHAVGVSVYGHFRNMAGVGDDMK